MTIKKTGGIFGRNPTFNDVEAESLTIAGNAVPDASTILVDGDIGSTVQGYDADTTKNDVSNTFTADQFFDEKVAIGHTTAFTPLYMRNDSDTDYNPASSTFNTIASFANWTSGALNNSLIAFNTESNGEWYIGGVQNAGNTAADFVFAARNAGVRAEKVRFTADGNIVIPTSGNGIDFSATAGTGTSELFDDYEEGTWTPVVAGLTTAGTYELQKAVAKYTKVGDLVTIEAFIQLAAAVTGGGAGSLGITGVPFAKPVDAYPAAAAYVAGVTISETPIVVFSSFSASSTLILQQNASGGFGTSVAITDVGVNDYISFSMTYKVA